MICTQRISADNDALSGKMHVEYFDKNDNTDIDLMCTEVLEDDTPVEEPLTRTDYVDFFIQTCKRLSIHREIVATSVAILDEMLSEQTFDNLEYVYSILMVAIKFWGPHIRYRYADNPQYERPLPDAGRFTSWSSEDVPLNKLCHRLIHDWKQDWFCLNGEDFIRLWKKQYPEEVRLALKHEITVLAAINFDVGSYYFGSLHWTLCQYLSESQLTDEEQAYYFDAMDCFTLHIGSEQYEQWINAHIIEEDRPLMLAAHTTCGYEVVLAAVISCMTIPDGWTTNPYAHVIQI